MRIAPENTSDLQVGWLPKTALPVSSAFLG